eukprot:scaffold271346_cov60-Attheya_sp.AAC.1
MPLEEVEMNRLFAKWQSDPWSPPPVGLNEAIPVNEFRNVELKLLNPGLDPLEEPRISFVATKLGLPYAPCLLGLRDMAVIERPPFETLLSYTDTTFHFCEKPIPNTRATPWNKSFKPNKGVFMADGNASMSAC